MPDDPATTQQADCHLWASTGRDGTIWEMSSSVTSQAVAEETSRPMSTTSTRPANRRPSPSRRPGLRAANVTVRSAGKGRPIAQPVRGSTPEGRSTARTGDSVAGAVHGRRSPVP